MAKGTGTPKPVLTKEQRTAAKRAAFLRVCEPRVRKAVKAIGLVGQCTSSNYLFTDKEAEQVTRVLTDSVRKVQEAFAKTTDKADQFSFGV